MCFRVSYLSVTRRYKMGQNMVYVLTTCITNIWSFLYLKLSVTGKLETVNCFKIWVGKFWHNHVLSVISHN